MQGYFDRKVCHLQKGVKVQKPAFSATRQEKLAEFQGMKSLVIGNPAAAQRGRLLQQLRKEILRAARLFKEMGQAFRRPVGGALEGLVVPRTEPGIQKLERQLLGDCVRLIPAFGA